MTSRNYDYSGAANFLLFTAYLCVDFLLGKVFGRKQSYGSLVFLLPLYNGVDKFGIFLILYGLKNLDPQI